MSHESTSDRHYLVQFGERLRQARKAAGLNQHALATAAGVSPGSIGRYERGVVSPTAEVIHALSLVLGGGEQHFTHWLMFGDVADLDAPPPIHLPSFGQVTALRFLGNRKGVAEVAMDRPEVERVLQACVEYAARIGYDREPVERAVETLVEMLFVTTRDGGENLEDISILADVPLGSNGVRVVPNPPLEGEEDVPVTIRAWRLVHRPQGEDGDLVDGDLDSKSAAEQQGAPTSSAPADHEASDSGASPPSKRQ